MCKFTKEQLQTYLTGENMIIEHIDTAFNNKCYLIQGDGTNNMFISDLEWVAMTYLTWRSQYEDTKTRFLNTWSGLYPKLLYVNIDQIFENNIPTDYISELKKIPAYAEAMLREELRMKRDAIRNAGVGYEC